MYKRETIVIEKNHGYTIQKFEIVKRFKKDFFTFDESLERNKNNQPFNPPS